MKPKKPDPEPCDTGPLERRGWMADVADICNSELAQGIATALVILAFLFGVLLGIGGCRYLELKGKAEVKQAQE